MSIIHSCIEDRITKRVEPHRNEFEYVIHDTIRKQHATGLSPPT